MSTLAKVKGDKVDETFFKAALQKAVMDSLFFPASLGEKHSVKLKPGFDTACWAYLPPHNIYIGTELFNKEIVRQKLTNTERSKYIENHYHHEMGHALFTERDMKKIKHTLAAIKAPLGVYNLFEDAYMEERYRREAEYRFEWLTLETFSFSPRPESLLFALIQAEGDLETVRQGLEAWLQEPREPGDAGALSGFADSTETLAPKLGRVWLYYQKIIGVKESLQLMPLLNAWLDEFGRPPENAGNGAGSFGGLGMQDMQHSAQLMADPEAAEAFDKGTKCVAGHGAGGDDNKTPVQDGGDREKAQAQGSDVAIASKGKVLTDMTSSLDLERVEALAAKFSRFFESNTRMTSTTTPQKRVSARHYAVGRAPYRRRELSGRGAKTLFFEVDCSGSMGGFHISEGRLILAALSRLARKGMVKGHVCLSAVVGTPSYETFALPLTDETIEKIQGFASAEGLEQALQANIKLARAADYVFVYTDGQICDKPINKGELHQQGVFTWGLYAGADDRYLDELIKYFDKAVLRRSAEDLVDAMLAQL